MSRRSFRDTNAATDDDDSDDGNVHYPEEFQDEEPVDSYRAPVNRAPAPQFDQEETAPPRREFKYSTANMNQTRPWKKYCLILLAFLFMLAIMIALSMLMSMLFFSDTSDNAAFVPEKDPNGTFPEEKMFVNQVCSSGTIKSDEGRRCRDACEPQFFECCDAFDEYDIYEIEKEASEANVDTEDTNFGSDASVAEKDWSECTLDKELAGCMAYAKCQTLGIKVVDPAPSTLSVLCSEKHLSQDPVSCQELCKPVRCCYSDSNDNCMAADFDICSDYAPCQNLRTGYILHTAPDDLDEMCLWQQPECTEKCELAKCCGDPDSSCLQNNFMACLTYVPCNDFTRTEIKLAPQFGVVKKPTNELLDACGEYSDLLANIAAVHMPSTHSCMDLCDEVKCCWSSLPGENCFFSDPLGCLAWEQQCQVLFQ
jgi:hypothetical protein